MAWKAAEEAPAGAQGVEPAGGEEGVRSWSTSDNSEVPQCRRVPRPLGEAEDRHRMWPLRPWAGWQGWL